MPRNGSGVYSLPAGVIVANGDTLDASQHNPALQDFATDANTPRPIVAGGTGSSSASAARTALGLAIGADVQPHDAALDALASLTYASDKGIYATGADTFATYDLTPTGRSISGSADAAAARNAIGITSAGSAVATAADAAAQRTAIGFDAAVKSLLNASGSAPIYACRAWVVFDGTGTVSIIGSGNVSSITDHGTGMYTINFTTAMPTSAYFAAINCGQDYNDYDGQYADSAKIRSRTTTSLRIDTVNDSSGTVSRTDMQYVNAAIFC